MFATKRLPEGPLDWHNRNCLPPGQSDFTKPSIPTQNIHWYFDGFISCWDEKYRSNLIRPETIINQHIDENWKPILQTPPFQNTAVDIR